MLSFNAVEYFEPGLSYSFEQKTGPTIASGIHLDVIQRGVLDTTNFLIPVSLDNYALNFIERNALWPAVDVGERIRYDLRKETSVQLRIHVDQDAEARDREELVLVYRIEGKSYPEILRLWDDVSRKVYQALPETLSDRVYVRMLKA